MDNLLLLSLLYAGLPLLIYIAIGTFIYSRGEVYRIYSLIFFISVPTLILVVSIFHFTITYFTGGYTSKEKPGYFIYKILTEKNIIPRYGTDEKGKSYETAVKDEELSSEESKKIIPASSGTGFFVSNKGHIITNNHVIEACHMVKVNYQGNIKSGKVLATDRTSDLSLLQTDIEPKDIFNISNEDAKLLEEVYVAGYPFGKSLSSSIKVTKGVVSALSGLDDNFSKLQIDAALQPGNSGGPIIDNKGNVVGVAVAKLDYEKVIEAFGTIPENINFGIKSSVIKTFIQSNNLKSPQIKTRGAISTDEIGEKINNATVYLDCWMTAEKIKKMKTRKTFFSEIGKGFDFTCYNACKERNDEAFCRQKCSMP